MDREIKVLALVPYGLDTTPSQRYRIEQWEPVLRQEGIRLDFAPFADERLMGLLHKPGRLAAKAAAMTAGLRRRAALLPSLRNYEAVYLHRTACLAGPAILERLMALSGPPIIFDFDDAIYLLDTTAANRYFGWLKFPAKTATICRTSAHVVVGNSYLADYARRHNPRVTVIPSSVDTERYRPLKKWGSQERIVIGWMGSSTSQAHLEAFAPGLGPILKLPGVELRVVSDREPNLPGLRFEWRRWSADSEIRELADFDIGIMPIPDSPWAQGKCAMKALLYMAMGVPTVCSAVGANTDVIHHGVNGLLANTPKEWQQAIELLAYSSEARERLGAAGRETVEQRYSMRGCAGRFAAVIQGTLEEKQSAVALRPSEEALNK